MSDETMLQFQAPYLWEDLPAEIGKLVHAFLYAFHQNDRCRLNIGIIDQPHTDAGDREIRRYIDAVIAEDFFFIKNINTLITWSFLPLQSLLASGGPLINTRSIVKINMAGQPMVTGIKLEAVEFLNAAREVIKSPPVAKFPFIPDSAGFGDHQASTKKTWDQTPQKTQLTDFPSFMRVYNTYASGDENISLYEHFAGYVNKLPERKKFLSLACGLGQHELDLLRYLKAPDVFEAVDISPAPLAFAREKATRLGFTCLNFFPSDVNYINLPVQEYDMIMVFGGLHHFYNLERVFWEISHALKTHGVFIALEYAGPNRLQFTHERLKIIQDVTQLLPPELRQTGPNRFKDGWRSPDLALMRKFDYSEAIRSEEIESLIEKNFSVLHKFGAGGTIINYVIAGIENNFDAKNPEHDTVIGLITRYEQTLIQKGILTHDTKGFICALK